MEFAGTGMLKPQNKGGRHRGLPYFAIFAILSVGACNSGKKPTDEAMTYKPRDEESASSESARTPDDDDFDKFFSDRFRRIGQAESLLVQRCMAKAGFTMYLDDPTETPLIDKIGGSVIADRDDDVTYRSKFGYEYWRVADVISIISKPENPETMSPATAKNSAELQQLTADEQKRWGVTLNGDENKDRAEAGENGNRMSVPDTGCHAEARKNLFSSLQHYLNTKQSFLSLHAVLLAAYDSSVKIKSLDHKWSECMKNKGFEFTNRPNAATEAISLYAQGHSNEAKEQEIVIAEADAACGKKISYKKSYEAEQLEILRTVTTEKKADIDALTAELQKIWDRANNVLKE